MGFDNAYEAITEEVDDHRWAFGTGFVEPLSGIDAALPTGVAGDDVAAYCLMLGDDALIMSHRLQQWLTNAPELEEETALANIALDLLGQARLLFTRAGAADGSGRDEDAYAFLRSEAEFRNVRLVEPVDIDFAGLVVRLLVFSTWRLALLQRLRGTHDPILSAVAGRGVNEVTYHRDYAAQWVVRLGDGTDFSRQRIIAALAVVAPFVDELFVASDIERRLVDVDVAVQPSALRPEVEAVLIEVLGSAGLVWPHGCAANTVAADAPAAAGHDGRHLAELRDAVAELQSVARACPGAVW
jgi:ring-1,2-phenylacetyl-CoA epoxidase subunit PaaC